MIGYREHLTDLVEKESRLHVVLGDNARYTVKGVGASSFQLDSDIPLQLSEVLYVPGMKRNLVTVSALEDKGYKVIFSEGKVLAWHKNLLSLIFRDNHEIMSRGPQVLDMEYRE